MRRLARLSTLLAVALIAAPAAADASPPAGERAARQALGAALDAFREPLAAGAATGERDLTAALRDLAVSLPALGRRDRELARDLLARPTDKSSRSYFGKEAASSPACSAQFCVHWTDNRRNRPSSTTFLNQIGSAIDRSYDVENGTLGWRRAKSDGHLGARRGVGAEGQVDVYVTNLGSNLYGYAANDPGQKGARRHAYLVLDRDYRGFPTPPVQSMRVTVAHEYNHILQFGYDAFEDLWLFESTATWMEEKVFPEIDDYLNYMPEMARRPQEPLTGRSIKVYAEAVWNHWLSGRIGDEAVRRAWEVSRAERHFAVDAYDDAIEAFAGPGFARELGSFFAASAEWKVGAAFPDHGAYPDVDRSGRVGTATRKARLDNTAYRLYGVKGLSGPSVTLTARAEKGTRSSISLVGRAGDSGPVTVATTYLPKGGRGEVTLADPGAFSRVTAVVANVDGRSNREDQRGRRIYRSDGSRYRFSLR
ncbi:MAG: hypothetical protein EDQ89_09670 [Acidobacteria bacterium]|nr:MAG: hypothetical protein EDQ89_09670 [Acidobacteriota bacterium]